MYIHVFYKNSVLLDLDQLISVKYLKSESLKSYRINLNIQVPTNYSLIGFEKDDPHHLVAFFSNVSC